MKWKHTVRSKGGKLGGGNPLRIHAHLGYRPRHLDLRTCSYLTSLRHISCLHQSCGAKLRFEQMSPPRAAVLGQWHILLYWRHRGTSTVSHSGSFLVSLKSSHGLYLPFLGQGHMEPEWVMNESVICIKCPSVVSIYTLNFWCLLYI